jgi:hypothetical protein
MSPSVKKWLLTGLGCLLAGAPAVFPALAPFAQLFAAVGGALGGGALVQRPGDVKAVK